MYHLIKQPEEQLRILFRNTAQKTGLHEAIVEKDFWVCLTGIKNLDINGFIETEEIVIPPLEIVERFDVVCQAIANKIYANGLENERLANLRDTLLPKLMSGEVDVSGIQL